MSQLDERCGVIGILKAILPSEGSSEDTYTNSVDKQTLGDAYFDSEAHLVSDAHEGAKSQRDLDFTKPYAQSYRVHGRFGSHPAHDAFDDDSSP